jgi:hypothetical protein
MRPIGQRREGQYQLINDDFQRSDRRTGFDARSWDDLSIRAEDLGIKGAREMSRRELVRAILARSERSEH